MRTLSSTIDLTPEAIGPVSLTVSERGQGRPVLVLHGGAGPQSVADFAEQLALAMHVRVLTPVHPGFGGTVRPDSLASVADLAALYLALLDDRDLTDVTVLGNSVGGWIATEMALLGSARIARLVLLDATGIEVPGHPVADVSGMALPEIARLGYADAAPFLVDPTTLPASARTLARGNMEALAAYTAGRGSDPGLLERLPDLALATAVLWGERDQIVDAEYGRTYAGAIPGASFQVLGGAGHAPQVETPEQVVTAVADFCAASRCWQHDYTENTTVSPETTWATLRKLYTGARFSDSGDDIVLHGPFATGTRLSVTPHGADFVVDCVITEVVDHQVFAYRSTFNGLHLTSRHILVRLPGGGTRVVHHSEIAGPGAHLAGPELGRRITEDRADTMRDLLAAAGS